MFRYELNKTPLWEEFNTDFFKHIFDGNAIAAPYNDAGDTFEIQFEAPGCKKEDVTIKYESDEFTILTQRKLKGKETKKSGTYIAPQGSNLALAEASVEDGIITVRIPKAKAASPRMIPIK